MAEHFKLISPGMAAARRRAAAMPPRENASSLKKESARVAKRCSDFTDKILHPLQGKFRQQGVIANQLNPTMQKGSFFIYINKTAYPLMSHVIDSHKLPKISELLLFQTQSVYEIRELFESFPIAH